MSVFFFNDTATTEIYTLSLHDALPICAPELGDTLEIVGTTGKVTVALAVVPSAKLAVTVRLAPLHRESRRLKSSHARNSHAASCLKHNDPFAALRSAASRLAAAPRAQD